MANQRPLELAIMYQLPRYWENQLQPFTEKYPEPEGEDRNASQGLLYGYPSKFGHVDGIIGELENFKKHHLRSNRNIGGCVGRGRIILANDDIEFDKNPLTIDKINEIIKNKKAIYDLTADKRQDKFEGSKLENYPLDKLPKFLIDNLNNYKQWMD